MKNVPADLMRQIPPLEAHTPAPVYTMLRFRQWDDVLREPAPPADLRFSTGIWRYARGVAFATTGRAADAARERDTGFAVRELETAVELKDGLTYDEPPAWFAPVRHRVGALLLAAGRPGDAERGEWRAASAAAA